MKEYLEKSCPFCDGKVFIESKTLSPYENHVVFICSGCGMQFEYTQNFSAYTKRGIFACDDIVVRVAQNPSPLEIWNQRKPVEKVLERLEEMFDRSGLDEGKKQIMRNIIKEGMG